jgi:hypothetical protein
LNRLHWGSLLIGAVVAVVVWGYLQKRRAAA